jgi:hypothetical protein
MKYFKQFVVFRQQLLISHNGFNLLKHEEKQQEFSAVQLQLSVQLP